VRVTIVRGGGVAGIATRTELTSDALGADPGRDLAERVAAAGLDVSAAAESPPGGERRPDELLYDVTVDDSERTRTLRCRETTLPAELRALIEWVDARPESERRVEPPAP
jgi:hypothetical protein